MKSASVMNVLTFHQNRQWFCGINELLELCLRQFLDPLQTSNPLILPPFHYASSPWCPHFTPTSLIWRVRHYNNTIANNSTLWPTVSSFYSSDKDSTLLSPVLQGPRHQASSWIWLENTHTAMLLIVPQPVILELPAHQVISLAHWFFFPMCISCFALSLSLLSFLPIPSFIWRTCILFSWENGSTQKTVLFTPVTKSVHLPANRPQTQTFPVTVEQPAMLPSGVNHPLHTHPSLPPILPSFSYINISLLYQIISRSIQMCCLYVLLFFPILKQ